MNIEQSNSCHTFAFGLLQSPAAFNVPEAQHFGFQLLGNAFRRNWDKWEEQEKNAAKQLLMNGLQPISTAPFYVRVKFGTAFVECVKREWPQRWPDLMNTLMLQV